MSDQIPAVAAMQQRAPMEIIKERQERERHEEQRRKAFQQREEEKKKASEGQMKNKTWLQSFSSDDTANDDDSGFEVFYCVYCGQFSLILDTQLPALPRREVDESFILVESKHTFKRKMVPGECVMVQRGKDRVEVQYQYKCGGCALPLAYTPSPFDEKGNVSFLLAGALTNDLTLVGKPDLVSENERQ